MTKLFVSDLDGTLLQSDERLTPHAFASLSRMLVEGLPFTVASARSIYSVREAIGALRLSLPVIEFNGAMATYLNSPKRVYCHTIQARVVREAAAAGRRMDVAPFVSTGGDSSDGDSLHYPVPSNDGMVHYLENRKAAGDCRLAAGPGIDAGLEGPVICLTFIERRDLLETLLTHLEREHAGAFGWSFYENPYSPGWWWLTLQPPLGNKGHAVRQLATHLRVDIEDVTVFGDNVNDIPMFEAAGRAVAVESAPDELKIHADEIIGPNTADSVVDYIAGCWRGRV